MAEDGGTMRARTVIGLVAGLIISACLEVGAQEIDMTSLKCKDFTGGPQDQATSIMFWLTGYYTYEDDAPVINLARLKSKQNQLRQYCLDNESLPLLDASEIFMDKKYHN
jgi:hypothetical protein